MFVGYMVHEQFFADFGALLKGYFKTSREWEKYVDLLAYFCCFRKHISKDVILAGEKKLRTREILIPTHSLSNFEI